ncbi:MAG: pyridoxal phosphate-dependent aminotransferase [Halobacteriota archaeon]
MFPRLSYLEWMGGRADAVPYDLGTTGLSDDDVDRTTVVPPRLADLESPPAGASLEHLLATEYAVQPEQVLVTAGATHANFLAYASALDGDGSTVLVEDPAYQPLVETPRGLGAEIARFDRGDGGALDATRLEEAVTDETALVSISNRHNPSGALSETDDLRRAADAAASHDAPLLVDEVYAPYVIDDRDGPFGGPSAAGHENAVVTGSLTKFFGLGGLRIGWIVGPREFVDRARTVAYHLPDVAGPSRALAGRALYAVDALIEDRRDRVETNHRLLAEFVEHRSDLEGTVHDGSTFAFLEPVEATVEAVFGAAWEEGVLVVPGEFYGVPEKLRVSAGRPPTDVEVSLGRFAQVLTDVRR